MSLLFNDILQKLFPQSKMEELATPESVRFRFYLEEDYSDAFLFYFKNVKLDFLTLWWLLC